MPSHQFPSFSSTMPCGAHKCQSSSRAILQMQIALYYFPSISVWCSEAVALFRSTCMCVCVCVVSVRVVWYAVEAAVIATGCRWLIFSVSVRVCAERIFQLSSFVCVSMMLAVVWVCPVRICMYTRAPAICVCGLSGVCVLCVCANQLMFLFSFFLFPSSSAHDTRTHTKANQQHHSVSSVLGRTTFVKLW